MGFIKEAWKGLTGQTAAEAAVEASEIAAGAQTEGLEYLKEKEALPMEMRDQALQEMQRLLLGGGDVSTLEASPLYQAIMSGQEGAEDAVMRHAAMTGGFRSGDTQENLARVTTDLRNKALMEAFGGISQMAGMPSSAPMIAEMIGDVGGTLAAGQTAAAQAQQQGWGNIATLGTAALMSDIRLKDDIEYQGEVKGIPIYKWVWNEIAENFGLTGEGLGPLAQDIEERFPDMVTIINGYKAVNTRKLLGVIHD